MTRTSAVVLALLLIVGGDGVARAQSSSATKPPATNDTSGMAGDKTKNAESAPAGSGTKGPDAKGTVDVSPGVGAVEGADGKPPLKSGTHK